MGKMKQLYTEQFVLRCVRCGGTFSDCLCEAEDLFLVVEQHMEGDHSDCHQYACGASE